MTLDTLNWIFYKGASSGNVGNLFSGPPKAHVERSTTMKRWVSEDNILYQTQPRGAEAGIGFWALLYPQHPIVRLRPIIESHGYSGKTEQEDILERQNKRTFWKDRTRGHSGKKEQEDILERQNKRTFWKDRTSIRPNQLC